MRTRSLLVAFLLAVTLCFVSGAGHGEIMIWKQSRTVAKIIGEKLLEDEPLWPFIERMREEMLEEIGLLKLFNRLLEARINYIIDK